MIEIQVHHESGVATVALNRPAKLNAITLDMYAELVRIVREAASDDSVRAVVLTSAGQHFSAGYDLNQVEETSGVAHVERLRSVPNALRWALWEMGKPVIAAVRGYCRGGACELALACDIVLAGDDLQIGEPEIKYGVLPAFLVVPWLAGPQRAKFVLFSGKRLGAKEALDLGLVSQVVPADELGTAATAFARELAGRPQPAMRYLKAAINRTFEIQGMRAAIAACEELNGIHHAHLAADDTFRARVREVGLKQAIREFGERSS